MFPISSMGSSCSRSPRSTAKPPPTLSHPYRLPLAGRKTNSPMSNLAASVDAPLAFLFTFVRHWRRATEQRCWAEEHFSRTPVKYEYEYEDYRAFPTACALSVLHWAD